MQIKKEKLLDKIVIKNYNNELEEVLEKKNFDENTKSILLNILYKIETSYKDYEKVKRDVETKDEFIKNIIKTIKNDCNDIKVIRLQSEENKMLGTKTFLVEKKSKRIICYPIERKLFYCIAKISKKESIINEKYFLLDKTLSELVNVGNCINTVEVMRDFNGYSWTTLPREIESISHNLVYQNLEILLGNKFLNNWTRNNEYIIDYMELLKNKLEDSYGKEISDDFLKLLNKLSILLGLKFNPKIKKFIEESKQEIEENINLISSSKTFVEEMTKEKMSLTEEIRNLDETINNKNMLQTEYEKRNEKLPLNEKIFSVRILSKIMADERKQKIEIIEELNELLKPKKFVEYKKSLKEKEKYLKLTEVKDIEKEIENNLRRISKNIFKMFLYQNTKSKYKTRSNKFNLSIKIL